MNTPLETIIEQYRARLAEVRQDIELKKAEIELLEAEVKILERLTK